MMATALRSVVQADDNRGRKAAKAIRRQQLIEATIECLAEKGYAETTLADVSDRAGLSRGIVNFHFESKENLLIATLQALADEYAQNWRDAVSRAGDRPVDQLLALVQADFARGVTSRRKLAAWCAFWGEAKSRPVYNALCGARDAAYQDLIRNLCRRIAKEGHYSGDPDVTALTIDALLEGLWLRLTLAPNDLSIDRARLAALSHLHDVFPRHFARPDTNKGGKK
jgi:TetR/AcrR family transcriptional repressor of bet genes